MKQKLKFEDFKYLYLEAPELDNKMKQVEKNRVDMNSLKETHKEIIKHLN